VGGGSQKARHKHNMHGTSRSKHFESMSVDGSNVKKQDAGNGSNDKLDEWCKA
jgi:hypothetical protein